MKFNFPNQRVFVLLFLFLTTSIFSQKALTGKLLDIETLLPIDDANIYYGDTGIGTVTNAEGVFEVILPPNTPKQALYFSHVNYKTTSVFIKKDETIYLEPNIHQLEEVVLLNLPNALDLLMKSMQQNRSEKSYCEQFFYKEFLKENEEYINYVEALGLTYVNSRNVRDVYVRGKRQTENKSAGFVKFSSNIHNLFKNVDLIKRSEVISRRLLDNKTYKITLQSLENNKVYDVYAEKGTYNILKIISDDLNDQLTTRSSSQRGYYKAQFINANIYRQGSRVEIDFKFIKGKQYISKIDYKLKVCMVSNDQLIKLNYFWDRLYLNTGLYEGLPNLDNYTRLTEKSNFFEKDITNNILDWSAENRVLPLDHEMEILNDLHW
ncbi:carboxypeptidase-like regulatory domain-containing protein [Flavicella sediminum]|uniref:carboxypeptidase-like regulatory domain-containing protein n=1 Tax=Flavicella sediminum TaxID=2585141 RepID=UPI00111EBC24|nr:carboxypeptidase-like regulatory domain-containing protein [Flavicella sediminum]